MRNLPHTIRVTLGLILLGCCTIPAGCGRADSTTQPNGADSAAAPVRFESRLIEAACGECQFGMQGDSCDLAVLIGGVAYFVDGTSIDDHGDAHAADGFCNAVRRARVTGEIVNGRFAAESFQLVED